MSGAQPAVLVVVPCLDEAAALPTLLPQLLADTPEALIVVADGGSTDGSRAIVEEISVREPRLVLLDNPGRLQSIGINRAVERFGDGCEWLVRIDAHCDYPAGYVSGLLAAAATHNATSVVVPMVSHGRTCFQRASATAQNSVLGTGGSPHRHLGEGRWVEHGHHALMRLDLFRRVGGYREDMPANEDAELDLRLAQAGARIWLEPAQAIVYYPRSTLKSLWRQYLAYGQGRARTLRLHRVRPRLRQLVPVAVPLAVLLALLAPLAAIAALPLVAWALLVLAGGLLVGQRAGGGCALGSGIAAATMHLAWGTGFLLGVAKPLGAQSSAAAARFSS